MDEGNRRLSDKLTGFVFAFVAIMVLPGLAYAQTQATALHFSDSLAATYGTDRETNGLTTTLTRLEDYLAYAAEYNPALKAAFYQYNVVLERSGYVGSLPNPTFSYAYYVESVETRVGPQNQRFGFMQSIPWFGTLGAKKDIVIETAKAAYQKYQAEKLKLFYQVKSSFYDYYYLGREIDITRENLQLLKLWESVARAKYRVVLKQHADLIKVQVELGKLEDRLRTTEAMMAPAAARLRAALNLPDSVHLPPPTKIEVAEVLVNRDSVFARVLTHNPDLKSVRHLIDKGKAGKRLAAKLSMPSFSLGVDYIQTGAAKVPGLVDSGKDPWMIKVGVNLPIWFGANKARKKEAEAQYRKTKYDYEDARNQLRVLTERIVFEYEDALRKTQLYRDGLLPKAEQSLNAGYVAYQTGEMDFLNVLDAQRRLLEFQLQFERSRTDLAIGLAAIEMITGSELELSRDTYSKDEGGSENHPTLY